MDTDFERASALVVQSVSTGTVTAEIFGIFQKLQQSNNRAALNKLEIKMSEVLSQTFTLDSFSLQFASALIPSDRDMPPAARNGFTLFFASPNVRKVELALLAAALLVKDDPLRALEMLSVAARYANSKMSKAEIPNDDITSAINVDVSIGSLTTSLSWLPESLSEIKINPSLSLLGEAKYWFQSQQMAGQFDDAGLRHLLKLKFDSGVLAQRLKQKQSPVQKSSLQ